MTHGHVLCPVACPMSYGMSAVLCLMPLSYVLSHVLQPSPISYGQNLQRTWSGVRAQVESILEVSWQFYPGILAEKSMLANGQGQ